MGLLCRRLAGLGEGTTTLTTQRTMGGSRDGSVGSYSSGSVNDVDVTTKYGTQGTQAKIAQVHAAAKLMNTLVHHEFRGGADSPHTIRAAGQPFVLSVALTQALSVCRDAREILNLV